MIPRDAFRPRSRILVKTMLVLAALATPAAATELYSWHSFDDSAFRTGRAEVIWHFRLRDRNDFQTLDQVRAGSVLRWDVNPRLTAIAGYYFQPGHERGQAWFESQRLFFGVEGPLWKGREAVLTGRVAGERHFFAIRPSYNRYRSYLRLHWNRRVSPYFQNEWLAVRQGFHSTRNSGGIRWKMNGHLVFEAGYLYDIRRTVWGGDRQAIVTSLRFDRRAPR